MLSKTLKVTTELDDKPTLPVPARTMGGRHCRHVTDVEALGFSHRNSCLSTYISYPGSNCIRPGTTLIGISCGSNAVNRICAATNRCLPELLQSEEVYSEWRLNKFSFIKTRTDTEVLP